MGERKPPTEEVLIAWLRSLPMPDELEDAILADPDDELVPLVLARWLLFNREVRLRPQTDPDVVKALRRAVRRTGALLQRKVSTMSHETTFLVYQPADQDLFWQRVSEKLVLSALNDKSGPHLRLVRD